MRSITSIVQQHFAREHRDRRIARQGQPVHQPITHHPAAVEQWSDSKLIAILRILRSEAARDCIAHMDGVQATQQDFAALRAEGLAFRRELSPLHELTDDGQWFAAQACTLVAKRLGLHHVTRTSTSDGVSGKCTCGFFRSFRRKYGSESSQLEASINHHLGNPDEWKRPDRTQEIIAGVIDRHAGGARD